MFSLFQLAAVVLCYADAVFGGTTSEDCDVPLDCEHYYNLAPEFLTDGQYVVCLEGDCGQQLNVSCDISGGGYTTILNRFNGSVRFNGLWEQMKQPIGSLTSEFWLGLESVHRLMRSGDYSLTIEIVQGNNRWQEIYNVFSLLGEEQNYRLRVEGFNSTHSTTGSAAMGDLNNVPFTTRDRDNDDNPQRNCAEEIQSPDWYHGDCRKNVAPFSSFLNENDIWAMKWMVDHRFILINELRMKIRLRRSNSEDGGRPGRNEASYTESTRAYGYVYPALKPFHQPFRYAPSTPPDYKERAPRDCEDYMSLHPSALLYDGVYVVAPERDSKSILPVFCDFHYGGYTVILNRMDDGTNFNGLWEQMKQPVGSFTADYWLGLEPVHRLTRSERYSVVVELGDGEVRWQENYNFFSLLGEEQNYKFKIEGYDTDSTTGNAALADLNNLPFTTRDRDNDDNPQGNCAEYLQRPGWMPPTCGTKVNLFTSRRTKRYTMSWKMHNYSYPIGQLRIKIRRQR